MAEVALSIQSIIDHILRTPGTRGVLGVAPRVYEAYIRGIQACYRGKITRLIAPFEAVARDAPARRRYLERLQIAALLAYIRGVHVYSDYYGKFIRFLSDAGWNVIGGDIGDALTCAQLTRREGFSVGGVAIGRDENYPAWTTQVEIRNLPSASAWREGAQIVGLTMVDYSSEYIRQQQEEQEAEGYEHIDESLVLQITDYEYDPPLSAREQESFQRVFGIYQMDMDEVSFGDFHVAFFPGLIDDDFLSGGEAHAFMERTMNKMMHGAAASIPPNFPPPTAAAAALADVTRTRRAQHLRKFKLRR